jgi:beta-phosphoglucomutase-like phosphatase (HAD superfamily)
VADNTTPLTPEQELEALKSHVAQLVEEARAKDAIIEGQDEQLAAAKLQGAGALSVVTYKKQRYQVLAGKFSLDDKVITHLELAANAELVKKLVEEKSGLLQLIPDAEKAS